MREIDEHRVNPANDAIKIEVLDEPGAGGASHHYRLSGFDTADNPANSAGDYLSSFAMLPVIFQNGPIRETGVNGVTHEALLAIVADRLRSYQAGPFACPENADALASVEEALAALLARTRGRMERGVEGTHEK